MIDDVITRLADRGPVKRQGGGYIARCPAHDDRNPSLSVTEAASGATLVKCHAGCTTVNIVHALGLEMRDLAPPRTEPERHIAATYDYHDADGNLVYQVVRFEPKDFRQRRPDGNGGWVWNLRGVDRVLYHLPDVIAAVQAGDAVWIAEGEKDADTLRAAGLVATTNPQGAGKWHPSYTETLRGADIVIVADRDDAGANHARTVAAALTGTAESVSIVVAAHGKDATDHIRAGGSLADFRPLTDTDIPQPEPNGAGPTHPTPEHVVRIDIPTLLASRPPDHAWVWDGYIERRTLTVLHGDGGTGKSILAGHLARAIVDGGQCLGRTTTIGNVLIVDAENPMDEIARRLHRLDMASVATDRIAYYRATDTILRPTDDTVDVDALVALIYHHHAAVAFLDSQRGLWSGDEREAAEIRPLYRRLQAVAEAIDCAIVLIHHDRRTGSYSGTSDVNNAADTRLHLTRPDPEKPERILHHAKARSSAELPPVAYTFGVDETMGAIGLFTFTTPREPVTDATLTRDALTDAWETSAEIAARAGIRKQDVYGVLWALTRDGYAEYAEGPEGRRRTAKCWRRRPHAENRSQTREQLGTVDAGVPDRGVPTEGPPPLRGGPPEHKTRSTVPDPGTHDHHTDDAEEPF